MRAPDCFRGGDESVRIAEAVVSVANAIEPTAPITKREDSEKLRTAAWRLRTLSVNVKQTAGARGADESLDESFRCALHGCASILETFAFVRSGSRSGIAVVRGTLLVAAEEWLDGRMPFLEVFDECREGCEAATGAGAATVSLTFGSGAEVEAGT